MSNFLVNPYAFGAAVGELTSIDLSASPTQDDFDIDVTDCNMLIVSGSNVTFDATTPPQLQVSTDGSTYVTASNSYKWYGADTSGSTSDVATATYVPFGRPNASITTAYFTTQITGFTRSDTFTTFQNYYRWSAGGSGNAGSLSGEYSSLTTVVKVRLGLLAQWGTTGTVYIRKVSFASEAAGTQVDYSVSNSSTTGISWTSGAYDMCFHRLSGVGTGLTRLMQRLADTTSIVSSSSYSGISTHVGHGQAAQANFSLDDTQARSAIGATLGLSTGGQPIMKMNGHRTYDKTAASGTGGSHGGAYAFNGNITELRWHEWDDNTNFSAGTFDLHLIECTSMTEATVTTAGSQTTIDFTIPDGTVAAMLVMPYGYATSANDQLLCRVSTDGGSTYKNTNYVDGYNNSTTLDSFTTGAWLNSTVTANACAVVSMNGFGAGELFTTCGLGGPASSSVREMVAAYTGDTDKVTDIRLLLNGAATFNNGFKVTLITWQ